MSRVPSQVTLFARQTTESAAAHLQRDCCEWLIQFFGHGVRQIDQDGIPSQQDWHEAALRAYLESLSILVQMQAADTAKVAEIIAAFKEQVGEAAFRALWRKVTLAAMNCQSGCNPG